MLSEGTVQGQSAGRTATRKTAQSPGVSYEEGQEGERKEGFFPLPSHSSILTPPCGDWAPWEIPLGGAGPNSNRFTKLSY